MGVGKEPGQDKDLGATAPQSLSVERYEDAIKKHEPLTLYESGLVEGLRMYAWMKDGVTYVGTTGTRLGVAVDKALTEARNLWS